MEQLTLMRRILTLSVLCLAVSVVNACRPDEIIETQAIPSAGVRFIHAVPDTGLMDFRFVDFPENNVQWQIAFRNTPTLNAAGANGVPASTFVQYKPARAGGGPCTSTTSCQRHFRIFMNPNCSPSACNTVLGAVVVKDTTVTLEPGKLYTALLWGYANPTGAGRPAGALPMRLTFYEEGVADPAALVAIRAINATNAAVDVRYYTTSRAITSITRTGTVATATTAVPHGLATGAVVVIGGANQSQYTGTFTITVTGASTFTYTVTVTPATPTTPETPATPATGTITYGVPPGTDLALNLGALQMSNHVTAATDLYRLNVRPAGGATNLSSSIDRIALIGQAAVTIAPGPFDAIPGTTIAGSAVTAIIFAPSVAGTAAPQGAGSATIPPWTDEAIVYVWDRRPPRPSGV
jgi:hypothetical protein